MLLPAQRTVHDADGTCDLWNDYTCYGFECIKHRPEKEMERVRIEAGGCAVDFNLA